MMRRFSISLEQGLLDSFDEYIDKKSYSNRSEAIRDLIRKGLIEEEWKENHVVMGVINVIYDHHKPGLQEKVTSTQHHTDCKIISATHVHMSHNNCLEVIIVNDTAKLVTELCQSLSAIKGVKDCKMIMSSTGDRIK